MTLTHITLTVMLLALISFGSLGLWYGLIYIKQYINSIGRSLTINDKSYLFEDTSSPKITND